jgi:hypothetical protein
MDVQDSVERKLLALAEDRYCRSGWLFGCR